MKKRRKEDLLMDIEQRVFRVKNEVILCPSVGFSPTTWRFCGHHLRLRERRHLGGVMGTSLVVLQERGCIPTVLHT